MKVLGAVFLALPALSTAYPGMKSMSRDEMTAYLRQHHTEVAALEERQLLSDVLTGLIGTVQSLTNTVSGLLGSIANNISPDNKRPENGYVFKAPGVNDSRGPCPGLNLLANYGYLPRGGHVTFQQVLEATSRGFNMGTDLATVLATFAVLTDGDVESESFYLGSLTGADGLNRHSTVEADVSPNREGKLHGVPSFTWHRLRWIRLLHRLRGQPPSFFPSLQAERWLCRSLFVKAVHHRCHGQSVCCQCAVL